MRENSCTYSSFRNVTAVFLYSHTSAYDTHRLHGSDRAVTLETRGHSHLAPPAIPDDATLKQVTVKKESADEWFATLGVEMDGESPELPENPGSASWKQEAPPSRSKQRQP